MAVNYLPVEHEYDPDTDLFYQYWRPLYETPKPTEEYFPGWDIAIFVDREHLFQGPPDHLTGVLQHNWNHVWYNVSENTYKFMNSNAKRYSSSVQKVQKLYSIQNKTAQYKHRRKTQAVVPDIKASKRLDHLWKTNQTFVFVKNSETNDGTDIVSPTHMSSNIHLSQLEIVLNTNPGTTGVLKHWYGPYDDLSKIYNHSKTGYIIKLTGKDIGDTSDPMSSITYIHPKTTKFNYSGGIISKFSGTRLYATHIWDGVVYRKIIGTIDSNTVTLRSADTMRFVKDIIWKGVRLGSQNLIPGRTNTTTSWIYDLPVGVPPWSAVFYLKPMLHGISVTSMLGSKVAHVNYGMEPYHYTHTSSIILSCKHMSSPDSRGSTVVLQGVNHLRKWTFSIAMLLISQNKLKQLDITQIYSKTNNIHKSGVRLWQGMSQRTGYVKSITAYTGVTPYFNHWWPGLSFVDGDADGIGPVIYKTPNISGAPNVLWNISGESTLDFTIEYTITVISGGFSGSAQVSITSRDYYENVEFPIERPSPRVYNGGDPDWLYTTRPIDDLGENNSHTITNGASLDIGHSGVSVTPTWSGELITGMVWKIILGRKEMKFIPPKPWGRVRWWQATPSTRQILVGTGSVYRSFKRTTEGRVGG